MLGKVDGTCFVVVRKRGPKIHMKGIIIEPFQPDQSTVEFY